jgi:hypothetical protein
VLLDDVRIVQQPLARRTDVNASLRSFCQPVAHFIQNLACIIEAKE